MKPRVARSDIPESTLRQRRNLYAISLTAIIMAIAGGKFDPSTALVFAIKFNFPKRLHWVMLVAWLYFLWRYYLHSPGMLSDLLREESIAHVRYTKLYRWLALRRVGDRPFRAEQPDRTPVRELIEKRHYVPTFVDTGDGFCLLQFGQLFNTRNHHYRDVALLQSEDRIAASSPLMWAIMFEARIRASIYERTFTDYILPYVIAALGACAIVVQSLGWL